MTDAPKPPSDDERTTDENEPSSSSPQQESPSAASTPTSSAPVTEPAAPFGGTKPAESAPSDHDSGTTPVTTVPVERTDADDDADEGEDEEPLEATRLSPYAIGSFAVGLASLFQAPTNIFNIGAQAVPMSQLLRFVLPTMLMPFLAAVISLWLSFRAEEEIFVAGGRFGGVGLYRAARVVSIATLLIVAAVIVVLMVLAEQPQPQVPQFG